MTVEKKPRPVAVLISDVHYSVHTLALADAALGQAIQEANRLKVPLVIAGDLHDTKANLRAECVNTLLETFNSCKTNCYILRGNHDAVNEKSTENALNFLQREIYDDGETVAYINVVNAAIPCNELGAVNGNSVWLIPYSHNPDNIRADLKRVDKGSCVIMHQGIQGSNRGEYIQDKSAIRHEDVQDFRVISGHYHTRQDIKTGRPRKGHLGLWSYIGNPYTLNYAEANDPPKGFRVLHSDGFLSFVATNLRKHIVRECDGTRLSAIVVPEVTPEDLLWIKAIGTREQLSLLTKEKIQGWLSTINGFEVNFKFTQHIEESEQTEITTSKNSTQHEIMDASIDSLAVSLGTKIRIKNLWKEML